MYDAVTEAAALIAVAENERVRKWGPSTRNAVSGGNIIYITIACLNNNLSFSFVGVAIAPPDTFDYAQYDKRKSLILRKRINNAEATQAELTSAVKRCPTELPSLRGALPHDASDFINCVARGIHFPAADPICESFRLSGGNCRDYIIVGA